MSKFNIEERRLLVVLACVQFTHVLDFVIMMPLGPQLMRTFSISAGQFGLMVSVYGLSASIAGLVASFFIDRYDRKSALLVLYSGFLVGTFLCAISPTYHALIAARAIAGAFGGISGAALFSIIGDAIHADRRGAATGIVVSSFSVASVVGVPMGLFFAQRFGWHMPFFGIVLVGLFNIIYGYRVLPSMRKHLRGDKFSFNFRFWTQFFTKKQYVLSNGFVFFVMMSNFIIIPFISPSLVANGGILESDLVYVYSFGGLFNFFTSQFIGHMADRFGAYRVFLLMAVISLLPIWIITHIHSAPLIVCMLAVALFMIFASGRMVPAMTLINSVVKPEQRGQFMSLNSAVQQMGIGLASFVSSHIVVQEGHGHLQRFGSIGYLSMIFVGLTCLLAGPLSNAVMSIGAKRH